MGRLLRNFPCFQEANDAWHANCGRGNERSRSRGGIGRLLHGVARRVDLHTFLGRIAKDLVFVVIDGLLDVVVVFAAYQQGVVESALGVGRWIGKERCEVDGRRRRRRSRRRPGIGAALFLDVEKVVEGEVGSGVGEVWTLRLLLALLPLFLIFLLLFLLLLLSSLFGVVVVPTLSIVVVVVVPWHPCRWDGEEGDGEMERERWR